MALAVLAERAAGRSFAVRWLVLTILRAGEAVAVSHVAEVTQVAWPGLDAMPDQGCRPVDALLLAFRLRALAALCHALSRPAGRTRGVGWAAEPRRPAKSLVLFVVMPGGRRAALADWAPGPIDTS